MQKRFYSTLIYLAMTALLFSACKSGQKLPSGGASLKAGTLPAAQLSFTYLSARGKLDYEGPDQKLSASVSVRIRQDSALWLSARKIGFEGVRLLARKDSLFVVDRLSKRFYAFDYAGLSDSLGVPLSYSLLEAVIVGNLPQLAGAKAKLRQTEAGPQVLQRLGKLMLESLLAPKHQRPQQLLAYRKGKEADANRLSLRYSDFEGVQGVPMARRILAELNYTDAAGAPAQYRNELKITRLQLTEQPLSMPYSVPDSYKPGKL